MITSDLIYSLLHQPLSLVVLRSKKMLSLWCPIMDSVRVSIRESITDSIREDIEE